MKLLKKIDDNLLKGLLTLFIFFIPLYPKFPFQIVNFTYIAIRLDDFMVALVVFAFIVELIRGKISLNDLKFKKPILVFWAIVFAAFLSGMFITKTIDYTFIGFLHAVRRVQYMIVFFIATAAVKSVRDFKFYMYALLASMTMVITYGVGQRLNEFPAVSTMNPEFAKGRVLFLTPEARLSSTFAGHYDLGAYLVFFFPLVWALVFQTKKFAVSMAEKVSVFLIGMAPIILTLYALGSAVYDGSIFGILMSALSEPRNATILATMGITLVVFMLAYKFARKVFLLALIAVSVGVLVATASRTSSIAFIISTIAFLLVVRKFWYVPFVLLLFGAFTYVDADLVNRWANTIQFKQIIINEETGEEIVVQKIRPDELPAGTAFFGRMSSDESSLSAEIKEDILKKKATLSGELAAQAEAENYKTYSATAVDISISTRFDVSWPRAWQAFLRNPLLGTGPSSITESSDGDYFRWIGELGALGAGAFMFILGAIMKYFFDARKRLSENGKYIMYALVFGTFGLMVNAILIDVFEASKVAYMFWVTLGLFVGLLNLKDSTLKKV